MEHLTTSLNCPLSVNSYVGSESRNYFKAWLNWGKIIFLGALATLAASNNVGQSTAATKTANFNAHIKLSGACSVSVTPMEFGSIATILGTETATSKVQVNCTAGSLFIVALAAGSGAMSGVSIPTAKVNYTATMPTTLGLSSGVPIFFTINGKLSVQATPSQQDYVEVRSVNLFF